MILMIDICSVLYSQLHYKQGTSIEKSSVS